MSLQRIWQDLVEEYGYGASYESVKRFVRTIVPTRRAAGVFHCAPGAEGQIDIFRGAPTLDTATGEWRRPCVFRALFEIKEIIGDMMAEKGYPDATITYEVAENGRNEGTLTLVFRIEKGALGQQAKRQNPLSPSERCAKR